MLCHPASRVVRQLLVCLLLFSFAGTRPAAAADRAIAITGDPSPGAGGGQLATLFQPDLNAEEHVVFRATLIGGSASEGLFLAAAAGLEAIAVVGDLAPDAGGATFEGFGDPVINDAGFVAFSARLTGGTATWGLFSFFDGAITTIATTASTAPGTAGGTYTSFSQKVAQNDLGEVAFVATIGGGSTNEGLFVDGAGAARAAFLIGDLAPTGVNGTYSDFSPPAINDLGQVAVTASFFVPPFDFTTAVVVEEAGGARAVARVGDPAPGSGGTYQSFSTLGAPGIDADGDVYFKATVSGGAASDGLFVDMAGIDSAVVLNGDAAPDTGGDYLFFSTTGLDPRANGDLAFATSVVGGSTNQGLFLAPTGGPDEALVLVGDEVPDQPGLFFSSLGDSPSMNEHGVAAHRGLFVDGGLGRNGVFVVPEPGVAVALWAGLIAMARMARARSRRRV